jgi:hypothetical protein
VIVIGTVTMMAVIGNGGRIRQLIGWERTWLSEDLLPQVGTRSFNERPRRPALISHSIAQIAGFIANQDGERLDPADSSERAHISLGTSWSANRQSRFLFGRNREILELGAFLGNVEGQRLHRRAVAGVLHVVHFSGRGGERLTSLQVHSGLALHLQGH